MDLQPFHKQVLAICAHDDVGLWRIIVRVDREKRLVMPLPKEVRQVAVEAIRVLLEMGLIEAGNPNGPTFAAIPGTPTAVVALIQQGLDDLEEPIGPGDVCWFRATPAGKELAHDLDLKGY